MSKEILVCLGEDDRKNQDAIDSVNRLENIRMTMVGSTSLLEGYVLLPFIESEDEGKVFGLDSINQYVNKILEKEGA